MNKREFLKDAILFFPAAATLQALAPAVEGTSAAPATTPADYDATKPLVWNGRRRRQVHRLQSLRRGLQGGEQCARGAVLLPHLDRALPDSRRTARPRSSASARVRSRTEQAQPEDPTIVRTFFVPKLCNQCAHPPCVQVCPVGATFQTPDGVVLVDEKRCIGCRYCIQACPYGARYLNPRTKTADKCTFCYHRITEGLLPACVEVCPTEARIFGDLKGKADRLVRFHRVNQISVLKPDLNTEPKVLYAQLDGEVR